MVDQAGQIDLHAGTVTKDNIVNTGIRRSKICWLERGMEHFRWLFETVDYHVAKANSEWFGIDYDYYGADSFQFSCYEARPSEAENDYYHFHEDDTLVSQRPTQRKISMMIQLSNPDDYEGGAFEFDIPRPPAPELLRQQGALLVFPSLVRHRVTAMTQGRRHSLVGWYVGPNWA